MRTPPPPPPGRKRRRDRPRPLWIVLMGTGIVIVGALALRAAMGLYSGVPTTDYSQYFVSVPNVGNLIAHDFVRIGGKRVGQVLDVDVGKDGQPRVELQLDPGLELNEGTRVKIRANGLLGARFVELTPGEGKTLLPEGATIEGGEKSFTYGLPEAVDTFDRSTRGGLRTTLSELGAGLADNGAGLNRTIHRAAVGAPKFDRTMQTILRREHAASRLLPALDSAVAALDQGSASIPELPDAAADGLSPVAEEGEAVHAILDRAPAALASAEDGLARGQTLLREVRNLSVVASTRVLPWAPEGLRELAALLDHGRGPLGRAEPVLGKVTTLGRTLRKVLVNVDPVTPRAQETVEDSRPILGTIGRHACDVVDAGVTLRSMTGFSQPGYGPNGPGMAFRLQVFAPNALETAGVTDTTGLLERSGLEPPCAWLPQKEYPQFVRPSATTGSGR